jgi:hypothetical protein
MKKISVALNVLLLCVLVSCSNDDKLSASGDEQVAIEQNASENVNTPVSALENGIIINGATKKNGNPPSPNSDLDFTIAATEKTGFQKSGFQIEFSSNADIAGAYVRFKDADGNGTSSYFDIPASSFGTKYAKKKSFIKNGVFQTKLNVANKAAKNLSNTIDVNLKSTVPAGVFCYDICLYDSQNNISSIQTVCVTIEAWGGNAKLVGKWKLNLISDNDGSFDIDCANGGTVSVTDVNLLKEDIFVYFNEDGTYDDSQSGEVATLDYNATVESCSQVYLQETEKINQERYGNWAFEEEANELTIVVFELKDLLDPDYSEMFEFGERVFNGLYIKELTNTKLVIEEVYDSSSKITYEFSRL